MSDGNTDSNKDDTVLHAAKVEPDSGYKAADPAEQSSQEAEAARAAAVSRAAHRDVAELVARNDAYIRHATEQALINVKKRADQARFNPSRPTEEKSLLRERLVGERKSASNATFGLVMITVLIVVGLIAGGIWYFSSQNSANSLPTSGVAPGVVTMAATTAKSTDVSAPDRLPAVIHVFSTSDGNKSAERSQP